MKKFVMSLLLCMCLCAVCLAVPVQVTLTSGDADGDNAVTLFDTSTLDAHYGASSADPDWNPTWDVDCSGSINSFDYTVVDRNFGLSGADALTNCSGTPSGSSVVQGTISIPDVNVNSVTLPITFQLMKVGSSTGYQFTQNITFTNKVGSFSFNVDSSVMSYVMTVYSTHFLRYQQVVSANDLSSTAPWHPTKSVRNGTLSVDTYTGSVRHTASIVSWPSKGISMDMKLSYDGSNPSTPWTHSYNSYITEDAAGNATVYFGNGDVIRFSYSGGQYTAPPGYLYTLSKNTNGIYTLSPNDGGYIYVYNSSKQLSSISKYMYYALNPMTPVFATTNLTYTNGKLTLITDPSGRSLTLGYSGDYLSSVTDPLSRVWNFTYLNGKLAKIRYPQLTDGTRYEQSYAYTQGLLSQITDADGKHWGVQYTNGLATALKDPQNNSAFVFYYYGYNTVTNPKGYRAQRLVFNTSGALYQMQEWFSPSWVNMETYGRDSQYRVTQLTDKRGQISTFEYETSGAGRLITSSTPDGVSKSINYEYVTSVYPSKVTTTVNTRYQTIALVNPNPNATNEITSYYYSGLMWVQTSKTSSRFDGYGNVIRKKNELGVTKTYAYDSNGNLQYEKILLPDNTTEQTVCSYNYDAVGRLTSTTDRLGRTSTYTYDSVNRLTSASLPNSIQMNYTYDYMGRLLSTTRSIAGGSAVTLDNKTYNSLGLLATHTNALNNTEQMSYGGNDLALTYTSYRGKQTSYDYDLHGANILTTHPMSDAVTITRDNNSDITATNDGVRSSSFTIDNAGRMATANYGSDTQVSYNYSDGNVSQITQGANVTTYTPIVLDGNAVNEDGSLYTWNMKATPQGDMGTAYLYGHDNTNTTTVRRMRTAVGVSANNLLPDVVTDTYFDYEGRTTGVIKRSINRSNPNNIYYENTSNNVAYTYYTDGRLNTTTYGNGVTEARSYSDIYSNGNDIGDRITIVATTNGSTLTKVQDYNAIGKLASTTINDLKRTQYTYDLKGQLLTETKQEKQSGTWVTTLTTTYTYDADGNRLTRTRSGSVTENTSYTYNDDNQLTSMVQNNVTTSYAYNAAGQLTSLTRNGQNISLTWTGSGRMSGYGSNVYSYNPLGQLVSVNSLRAKSIFGDSAASQVWRDGDTYQLWGLGLAGRFSDSLIEFDHQDATGSINMTTASNGVINGNLEMDAYGDLESATGNLQWGQTPYRYIGGLNCQSEALATFGGGTSGGDSYRLVLMGERWYDPQAGRFISRDPVFSENLYAYCGNDPINAVDPEGKFQVGIDINETWMLVFGGQTFGLAIMLGNQPDGSIAFQVKTYKGNVYGLGFGSSTGAGVTLDLGDICDASRSLVFGGFVDELGGGSLSGGPSGTVGVKPSTGMGLGVYGGYVDSRALFTYSLSKLYEQTVNELKQGINSIIDQLPNDDDWIRHIIGGDIM